MPIVINNVSPIINLAIIGRLNLLKTIWGKIHVPGAVWKEVVIDGGDKKEVAEIKKSDAREAADIYKLEKTGVLGILLLAKLKKEIPNLKPEIEKLKLMANFRLKDSLVQLV